MPEVKFAPFQRVLVRSTENQAWSTAFFSHEQHSEDGLEYVCGGQAWNYCIPYEGNERLLGVTDSSTPQKFKFGDHVEVAFGEADWSKAVFIRKVDGTNPYECLLECPWGDHAVEARGVHCRHADW